MRAVRTSVGGGRLSGGGCCEYRAPPPECGSRLTTPTLYGVPAIVVLLVNTCSHAGAGMTLSPILRVQGRWLVSEEL